MNAPYIISIAYKDKINQGLNYFINQDYRLAISHFVQANKLDNTQALPFLLSAMTIIASIIMIYNKFKDKILLNLFIGILFSVLVYYLGNFSNLLGENGKLPLTLSVWFPVIMLLSFSLIGIIRLNEK